MRGAQGLPSVYAAPCIEIRKTDNILINAIQSTSDLLQPSAKHCEVG